VSDKHDKAEKGDKAEKVEKPEAAAARERAKAAAGEKKEKAAAAKERAKTSAASDAGEAPPLKKTGPPRLKQKYLSEVRPKLKERFGIANDHALPRLMKIVVNMGVGTAVENKARVTAAAKDLGMITGQLPTIRNSREDISAFKLRAGMPIGCAVTMRGDRMWEFADRLISVVLPRIRDFRGVKDRLDGRGNYSLGLSEQTVFPEIELDKIEFTQGMDVTFVTTAANDEQGYHLLKELGMPFQQKETAVDKKKSKQKAS
jgi:large subunit ribosomal protein L5